MKNNRFQKNANDNPTEARSIIRIRLDFSHGPIWKDRYDAGTGRWSTGIEIVDGDRALAVLDNETAKEYSALYSFDAQGVPVFDEDAFELKKPVLASLVETITLRLDDLNDGTFEIINEEAERLKIGIPTCHTAKSFGINVSENPNVAKECGNKTAELTEEELKIPEWDPDFTKATSDERVALEKADNEMKNGIYIREEEFWS